MTPNFNPKKKKKKINSTNDKLMYNVMTENQIPRICDRLTALTPISFRRLFIYLFLIIYLHNASPTRPPLKGQDKQHESLKGKGWSKSQSQWIK